MTGTIGRPALTFGDGAADTPPPSATERNETMTVSRQEPIDFTLMYATHDAFRRDVGRLMAASAAGKSATPPVQAGWPPSA
jgi:hypothetical protein